MSAQNMLAKFLSDARQPDDRVRRAAEEKLEQWKQTDYVQYLLALIEFLANGQNPNHLRVLSGLMLKNTMVARDVSVKMALHEKWLKMPENVKTNIKKGAYSQLSSPTKEIRGVASQIISRIALIELPARQWGDLIDKLLLSNMTDPKTTNELKEATLETLGYICEEIDPSVLSAKADKILTAVIQGMRDDNPVVRLAACAALRGALEFSKKNFETKEERDYIMQTVLDCTRFKDMQVRIIAFELLVKIASLYYEFLTPYIQKIFQYTLESIQKDKDDVGQQAIEFWSTLCDEEILILAEAEEALQFNVKAPRECSYFVKGAVDSKFLVPVLTMCLTKQSEHYDPDEWNVSMAAGTCLNLIANTIEDDIVPHVMPFVQSNITSPDWRFREAATLAFGSILEGPKGQIKELIKKAVPVLLRKHLQDSNLAVKDTTAWTLGRICQLHPESIPSVDELIPAVSNALRDEPRVASNCCWCLHNLAVAYEESPRSPLTQHFNKLVRVLLATTERNDADEANLRCSAYEALNVLLLTSPPQLNGQIKELLRPILERLDRTFSMQIVNRDDKKTQIETQGLLCSVVHAITQKLGKEIKDFSHPIMTLYLKLFKETKEHSTVHREIFMGIGALANSIGEDFETYMKHFHNYLYVGLSNFEDYEVCAVAVGIVGDICRALGHKIEPYCDKIVTCLLQDLNPSLNKSVKPTILSCFGDIALAIETKFERYLPVVMNMLQQASVTAINVKLDEEIDYDLIDYMNQLREGIFEAYTGIVHGLKGKSELLMPHLQHILKLIFHCFQDKLRMPEVTRAACGLIGDLATTMPNIRNHLQQDFIVHILNECSTHQDSATREIAVYAKEAIQKLNQH